MPFEGSNHYPIRGFPGKKMEFDSLVLNPPRPPPLGRGRDTKTGSTPAVVPDAAPALVKAGVGGSIYIYNLYI